MLPRAVVRFGADAYIVLAQALSCDRDHHNVRPVEIGALVYDLCPGCRRRAAA